MGGNVCVSLFVPASGGKWSEYAVKEYSCNLHANANGHFGYDLIARQTRDQGFSLDTYHFADNAQDERH